MFHVLAQFDPGGNIFARFILLLIVLSCLCPQLKHMTFPAKLRNLGT